MWLAIYRLIQCAPLSHIYVPAPLGQKKPLPVSFFGMTHWTLVDAAQGTLLLTWHMRQVMIFWLTWTLTNLCQPADTFEEGLPAVACLDMCCTQVTPGRLVTNEMQQGLVGTRCGWTCISPATKEAFCSAVHTHLKAPQNPACSQVPMGSLLLVCG